VISCYFIFIFSIFIRTFIKSIKTGGWKRNTASVAFEMISELSIIAYCASLLIALILELKRITVATFIILIKSRLFILVRIIEVMRAFPLT